MKHYVVWFNIVLFFCISAEEYAPKVSVITSLYKGKYFLQQFMQNIVEQTYFDQCEFIIIHVPSADATYEERMLRPYIDRHANIIYRKLSDDQSDPGLYGVWNMAIFMARGQYIINANVDDRLAPYGIEVLANALDRNPEIDLVYSACYISKVPNEPFELLHARPIKIILDWPAFSRKMMQICLPGNHPMWRKSMHDRCGFFDESYKAAGDWEFFLRAVEHGCVFMKVPAVLGTFYENPRGLTRNQIHGQEMNLIIARYSYIWA